MSAPSQPAMAIDTSLTGDEAYARRLALSQGRASAPTTTVIPSVPPKLTPVVEISDQVYPRNMAMDQPQIRPQPEASVLNIGLAMTTTFTPSQLPPTDLPVSAMPQLSNELEERLKSSREAAAAVAARLSQVVANAPAEPVAEELPTPSERFLTIPRHQLLLTTCSFSH